MNENKVQKKNRVPMQGIGILLLILFASLLIWYNQSHSMQAISAMMAKLEFRGEYRIEDGQWQEIVEGKHIPATKGDVTLRGQFHVLTPDGDYIGVYDGDGVIGIYSNHISVSIFEGEGEGYLVDSENRLYGPSSCGISWTGYSCVGARKEPIEILIHNPHRYGNENAVDQLISNIALWNGIDFEKEVLGVGKFQRDIGLTFMIVAFGLLGTAIFSTLLHMGNNRIIWLFGLAILFAGLYLTYSAFGVSFCSESVVFNTTILGCSMMFYMFFVSGIITTVLEKTKKIGYIATIVQGIMIGICFLLPVITPVYFYDTWAVWAIGQTMVNLVLLVCLGKEFRFVDKKMKLTYVGIGLLLISFEMDAFATATGLWQGGLVSRWIFVVLFIAVLFVVLRIIPENINSAEKAKELEIERSHLEAEKNRIEAELKERRISLMLSQIQPHFIYNTLGTIERMCLKDSQKAFELVRNFSLYLRGNFSELDSVTPIRFIDELKHVEYYVNIEKVRFPDMNIEYDVKATDFVLPALSVQPLVENAIKHGLMRLESGGTVVIRSYETEAHFCVEVEDDGVGFDTSLPIEEKKHVGLRNIRGRLNEMVGGELIVESHLNAGTKAIIMIPKEGTV